MLGSGQFSHGMLGIWFGHRICAFRDGMYWRNEKSGSFGIRFGGMGYFIPGVGVLTSGKGLAVVRMFQGHEK